MKIAIPLILLLIPSICIGRLEKSPTEMYKMNNLITEETTVTIIVTDNVQKTCNAESHKRNLGGFGHEFEACSFWNNTTCTIVVGKKTNNDILGHEIRHCFQGHFH